MSLPIFLYGALATHRRGKVLEEAFSAVPTQALPPDRAITLIFADTFQMGDTTEQSRLTEWTRASGHLLLLVPPFVLKPCARPVSWSVERLDTAPRGGEGLAKILADEVSYRLAGHLQAPAVPGATWADLSLCIGSYRLHPAAGLFAVTCLPLWSLSVLDASQEATSWLTGLLDLAGPLQNSQAPQAATLQPDHYGLLLFLLSRTFKSEEEALECLGSSPILRFGAERSRSLLQELRERGLVQGTTPTTQAYELVMQSPYAHYISALREVSG